ncbi:L-tyrosine:2-oxoglutarate aminotransferase amt1 [Trichinella pseudospiralis]
MEISSSSRIFQTVSDFLHSYKSLASAFPRRFLLIEYDHNASNLNSRIKIISRNKRYSISNQNAAANQSIHPSRCSVLSLSNK